VWKKFTNIVGVENMSVPGDVDGDGKVSITDVTGLIDLLMLGTAAQNPAGDVDGDGRVNITDVTAIIDLLFVQ
jgi:hypothetical protein